MRKNIIVMEFVKFFRRVVFYKKYKRLKHDYEYAMNEAQGYLDLLGFFGEEPFRFWQNAAYFYYKELRKFYF